MASGMPYDRSRQAMIRDHINEQARSAGGTEKLPHEKLIMKGQAKREPVYRFALVDLAFNKANGRIKAEVMEKEIELGRPLEVSNLEDQKIIKEILLLIRPDENEKIRDDLQKNGQLRPGIITCDGILANGNRRKAILEDLHGTTHDDQFNYLDVQVLPSDITKAELWLIEANLQLSAPQQLDYSPINQLLKFREGIAAGLDPADMASRIFGVSEERIRTDLERLNLIDQYLGDFLQKPERYYLVKRLNEHFIDLEDILGWAKRPRGNVPLDWSPNDSDRAELVNVAFVYIRAGFAHLRIRELRDLFATEASWLQARKAINVDLRLSQEDQRLIGLEEKAEQDEDMVDDESATDDVLVETLSPTAIEEHDIQEEILWREATRKKLEVYFGEAKEQKQIAKDSKKPLALARRALRMVEAIPTETDVRSIPDLEDVLRNIICRVNLLRKTTTRKGQPRKPSGSRGRR